MQVHMYKKRKREKSHQVGYQPDDDPCKLHFHVYETNWTHDSLFYDVC